MDPTQEKKTRYEIESELLNTLEFYRRERKDADVGPLDKDLVELVARKSGTTIQDYAWYQNLIAASRSALEESLPNGQHFRSVIALALMEAGMVGLKNWMRLRGMIPQLDHLQILLDTQQFLGIEENPLMLKKFFKNRTPENGLGPVIPGAVSFSAGEDGELIKTQLLMHSPSQSPEGQNRMRALEVTYRINQTSWNDILTPTAVNVIDFDFSQETPEAQQTASSVRSDEFHTYKKVGGGAESYFIEPGSGIEMRDDRYYIISDSGSAYSSTAFESISDASKWFATSEYAGETLTVPWFSKKKPGFFNMGAANLVYGADLLEFWRSTTLS